MISLSCRASLDPMHSRCSAIYMIMVPLGSQAFIASNHRALRQRIVGIATSEVKCLFPQRITAASQVSSLIVIINEGSDQLRVAWPYIADGDCCFGSWLLAIGIATFLLFMLGRCFSPAFQSTHRQLKTFTSHHCNERVFVYYSLLASSR